MTLTASVLSEITFSAGSEFSAQHHGSRLGERDLVEDAHRPLASLQADTEQARDGLPFLFVPSCLCGSNVFNHKGTKETRKAW